MVSYDYDMGWRVMGMESEEKGARIYIYIYIYRASSSSSPSKMLTGIGLSEG